MKTQGGKRGGRTFVDPAAYEGQDDGELVRRILGGERELFEVIMRRYNQQLYRVIWSYLGEEEKVKDVMQTAWIKAWEKLDTFRGEARLSTWLVRIAINEALQVLRRNGGRDEDLSVTELLQSHPIKAGKDENPHMKAEHNDLVNKLEEAIRELPPKYRTVFVMREMEQMSTGETAELLEISRSNVKVRLHRARNMLQEHLEKITGRGDLLEFMGARCDAMVRHVMEAIADRGR